MSFRSIIIIIISIGFIACGEEEAKKIELKTLQDSAAYSIGMQWGMNFKRDSLMFDVDILKKGIYDALYGDTTTVLLTTEEVQQTLQTFQQELQKKQMEEQAAAAGGNKIEGKAFLEENKKKEGVVLLPSGLQYKVIKEGSGKKPTATSNVKVHYKGTLIDGTVFDSSYDRGQPATFGVNKVIPGWTEALQLMQPGAKWMLYLPSELAYGDRAAGQLIKPGSTLIFEVELLEILD